MRNSIRIASGLFVLSTAFCACSNSGDEAVKNAENEVFAIHDKIMPLFDDIMKMRKMVKKRLVTLDSTKAVGSASTTLRIDEEREQGQRVLRDLNVADSLMMYWMDHYKNDTIAKLPSEDALRYLEQQKDQIIDVQTKFNTSLSEANQYLQKP